jgi:DNA polymerase
VFGEGAGRARVMLVGEQPGNDEDLEGRPFVGPAWRVLDRALEAAGIARDGAYVTNVVKHFKWKPQGKRRIHERPNRQEISACSAPPRRRRCSALPSASRASADAGCPHAGRRT